MLTLCSVENLGSYYYYLGSVMEVHHPHLFISRKLKSNIKDWPESYIILYFLFLKRTEKG